MKIKFGESIPQAHAGMHVWKSRTITAIGMKAAMFRYCVQACVWPVHCFTHIFISSKLGLIHTHTDTHTHTYAHRHTQTHRHTHTHIQTHTTHTHIHTHTHTYIHTTHTHNTHIRLASSTELIMCDTYNSIYLNTLSTVVQ